MSKLKEATPKDAYLRYARTKGIKDKTVSVVDRKMKALGAYTSKEYYEIVNLFFKKAVDKVINGSSLLIPRVGFIYIKKCEHIPEAPFKRVDWGTSNKYKKKLIEEGKTPYKKGVNDEGELWLHYHNTDYLRWAFYPVRGTYNKKYLFKPTERTKNKKTGEVTPGAKKKLYDANYENPFLRLKYLQK